MAETPREEAVLARLSALAALGLERSGSHLSSLLHRVLRFAPPSVALVSVSDLPRRLGDPSEVVVAVHTAFSGDLSGQVLFLLAAEAAETLVAHVLEGETDPAYTASILSEIGNIAATSFLNVVADWFGVAIRISPPAPMRDYAGAILGSVVPLVEVSPDRVLMVATQLEGGGDGVSGSLLFLPDAAAYKRLKEWVVGASAG